MPNNPLVTVVIPTVKNRNRYLRRAVSSVLAQTLQPIKIEIAIDRTHAGSAATRNRALSRVTTPWVAFLDDDDFFLPDHIESCFDAVAEYGAQVVYPGCRVIGPNYEEIPLQPQWGRFGQAFDGDLLMKTSYI